MRTASLALAGIAMLSIVSVVHGQTSVAVDPVRTYLKNCETIQPTVPISLSSVGVAVGNRIKLVCVGDLAIRFNQSETVIGFVAVFSSSSTISSNNSTVARVPGALDAGIDQGTGPALDQSGVSCGSNDISQDFYIAGPSTPSQPQGTTWTTVIVPLNAQYLFVSAADVYFSDNSDPDSDLAVQISVLCPADVNGDGGVDSTDLVLFLAQYDAGTALADVDNGSSTGTPDGGVDINDLLYYLTHFEAGC